MNNKSTLSPEAIAIATTEGRKEGVFAGLTSALASALIGSKLFRLNRNHTLAAGILTGVLSGYYFTQAFTSSALAEVQRRLAITEPSSPGTGLVSHNEQTSPMRQKDISDPSS